MISRCACFTSLSVLQHNHQSEHKEGEGQQGRYGAVRATRELSEAGPPGHAA